MDKVTAYFRGELLRIKKEDPARFQEIYDHECPHDYGLPSFHNNHTCVTGTCEQCWKNAMGFSCRNQKIVNLLRMVMQWFRTWVRWLKGGSGKKC